jgi:hypothetical protein
MDGGKEGMGNRRNEKNIERGGGREIIKDNGGDERRGVEMNVKVEERIEG